jgi:hypothetical protein
VADARHFQLQNGAGGVKPLLHRKLLIRQGSAQRLHRRDHGIVPFVPATDCLS